MKKLAASAVMLLATGSALAQTPAPSTSTPAPAAKTASGPTVEARVDRRAAQMHEQLKITAAQETAWSAFAQAMRDNVSATDEGYKQRSASLPTMSAADNMRNFAQIEQARAQGVQNMATTFQALYDTLSDDQKKTADTLFRHYGEHRGRHKPASK
jgi:protein CpxP